MGAVPLIRVAASSTLA